MKRNHIFSIAFIFTILFSSTAFAERLAVSSSIANIRSGPGKNYDILWKAGKYYPLSVLEKSGNWIHFSDYEGDEGWIHRSLVSKIPTVITKTTSNIRSGPGTSHKILITLEKGIPFKVIKREGNWINIQHADGDRGWIHESLVW